MKYNVIIAATGHSSRFKQAGYGMKAFLPMITPSGEKMSVLKYTLSQYKNPSNFYVITRKASPGIGREDEDYCKAVAEVGAEHVINIEADKLGTGPAPNNLAAMNTLSPYDDFFNEPVFASYCDQFIWWDWDAMVEHIEKYNPDAMAITSTGWSPALDRPDPYGYAWVTNPPFVDKIEEKINPPDRFNMHTVDGIYYFRTGRIFKEAIERQLAEGTSCFANGEFYTSLTVEQLCKEGKKVTFFDCQQYDAIGTPEDYELYNALSVLSRYSPEFREKALQLRPLGGAAIQAGFCNVTRGPEDLPEYKVTKDTTIQQIVEMIAPNATNFVWPALELRVGKKRYGRLVLEEK
jgi:hypothetical protein